ncbi:MAG: DNA-binding protein WhiA [Anaeroplasmataceae bacterium]|nr:DNA-binding protein WhiA [Anaeroplasmataceae bacterium]
MSYCTNVKEDILKVNSDASSHLVELEACLRLGAEVVISNPIRLIYSTSNMHVIRYFITLIKKFYIDVEYQLISRKLQKLNRQTIYSCVITKGSKTMIEELGLLEPITPRKDEILESTILTCAYLKGAFITKGSVNDPKTSNYHLELCTSKELEAFFLQRALNIFELNARIAKRRSNLIVYLKEKDKIVDCLRYMGANVSMNEFENTIIQRDISAHINRQVNIDIANQQKTNKSAKEQIKYIKYLEANYPTEKLDDKLKIVMKVRKENPEASLTELINLIHETYDSKITKSGLNHRLRKIKEIALDFDARRKKHEDRN